jgi:hypothetical protein
MVDVEGAFSDDERKPLPGIGASFACYRLSAKTPVTIICLKNQISGDETPTNTSNSELIPQLLERFIH